MIKAVQRGHFEIVQRLLEVVNPGLGDSIAFKVAIRSNSFSLAHNQITDLLMKDPRVNVAAENSWAIKWASASGDARMVDRLLPEPRVDPSADNNLAIQSAFDEQHTSIVSLLLQDDRVGKSLTGPIRLAIISDPDMYSTGFINSICEKDGIPSNNFLCRLLVAVFTRQLNMNDARTEMWPHYMQNRYARSMAGQFRQLWEFCDSFKTY